MAERVFISKESLEAAKSCGDHTASPEWTGEGLDYSDLPATMARLAKTHRGRGRLMWLAQQTLIPRSEEEIRAFLDKTPCEVYDLQPPRERAPAATSARETQPAPEPEPETDVAIEA